MNARKSSGKAEHGSLEHIPHALPEKNKGITNLHLQIETSLHRELRVYAVQHGIPLKTLAGQIFKDFLSKNKKKA